MLSTHGRVAFSQEMGGAAISSASEDVLNNLSRIEKLILTLTYHENLSLRETGVVLGLTEHEVRRTLASTERRFARALDEERAALEMA